MNQQLHDELNSLLYEFRVVCQTRGRLLSSKFSKEEEENSHLEIQNIRNKILKTIITNYK